jgi:hypothetical protein
MYLYTLEWGNPYTEPPTGRPRCLAAVMLLGDEHHGAPRTPDSLFVGVDHHIGDGYSVYCSFIPNKPARVLPLASKQSIRRKRLMARLVKHVPLFAAQLYTDALTAKPDYYGKG